MAALEEQSGSQLSGWGGRAAVRRLLSLLRDTLAVNLGAEFLVVVFANPSEVR